MNNVGSNFLKPSAAGVTGDGGGRPLYVYATPPRLHAVAKSVGLVELTAEEELMAAKRANNNPVRLAYELAKESLRQFDGRAVSLADGTSDTAWNVMGPVLRTLVITAYQEIHNPREDDAATFLASREVQFGG